MRRWEKMRGDERRREDERIVEVEEGRGENRRDEKRREEKRRVEQSKMDESEQSKEKGEERTRQTTMGGCAISFLSTHLDQISVTTVIIS